MRLFSKPWYSWKTALLLFSLPILITTTAYLIAFFEAHTRYDPQYFTGEYQQKYQSASPLLEDLLLSLRTGDEHLMAQLEGTRQVSQNLEPRPDLEFVTLLNRSEHYYNYLFQDRITYHRYMARVKIEDGRYVVVPENLYYFFDSGRWTDVFGPPTILWWSALIIITSAVWLYQWLANIRKKMLG